MDKVTFIREQLSRVPDADFSNPDQVKILCPFHDDSRPSLDVSLINILGKVSVGGFNCWACKDGHGGWNKLAIKLGLEIWEQKKYENQSENVFLAQQAEFAQFEKNQQQQEYVKPFTEGAWKGSWRGLSGSFLRSVGCEALWDKIAEEYRLWFPVFDFQHKLVGHIAARGENSDIENRYKYLNSDGFSSQKLWYGLSFEKNPKWLVIVEGPYDCLRLRSLGIPAIAVLGIKTLTDQKILQILSKGCTKVLLALDADQAGREYTPIYAQQFENYGFEVQDLNLTRYLPAEAPDTKMDPGDCPDEVIQDIKNFLSTN
jgi:5S rRNA maturation endonuclease (ribonuclease M5)